ncbi:MAG: hypothetical protein ACOH19_09620 [Rhodoglobus sp.]
MTLMTQFVTDLIVWTVDEPTPAPTMPGFTGDQNMVTPGVIGFFLTFVVMVVVVLLIIDMVRRVRRVNYRAEIREKLEAELAAEGTEEASVTTAATDGTTPRPEG